MFGLDLPGGLDGCVGLVEPAEHDEVPIAELSPFRRSLWPFEEALPQRQRFAVVVSPIGKTSRLYEDQRMIGMEGERRRDRRLGLLELLQFSMLGGESGKPDRRARRNGQQDMPPPDGLLVATLVVSAERVPLEQKQIARPERQAADKQGFGLLPPAPSPQTTGREDDTWARDHSGPCASRRVQSLR